MTKKSKVSYATWAVLLVAMITVFGIHTSANAEKTINLTAIDGYPTKSLWVKEFINFYIPEINKRLAANGNYKIRWNQAWGGQIVKPKHVLEGLQKGLGDIGVVTTVFHHDKVPLQAVAYVTPFVTTDPGLVARTVDEIAQKFPAMKNAWESYNQVYLTNMAVFDTYQVFSKKQITKRADFKGLKINAAGTNLRWLQGLGVAGVGGSLVTFYQNMSTGVVDGCILWPESAVAFKFYEVAPYMLDGRLGSANSKAVTVNADTWKRLPGEVRQVLAETAIAYRDHMAKLAIELGEASSETWRAKGGKIYPIAKEERDAWAKNMPNIAKEWAESLEKKGIPGRAALTFYMDTMRRNNQPIARQWDRE
jgi:TRAP-type C4-dicarboxylate transport system substrate-binding protein